MKIIDFERRGNAIRFYLGDDDCKDYWGDDWDDRPYETNAGMVYERYVRGYTDVTYDFSYMVLEPDSGEYISSVSKEDMKKRRVPCIIVVPPQSEQDHDLYPWEDERYSHWIGAEGIRKYYFGDPMECQHPWSQPE